MSGIDQALEARAGRLVLELEAVIATLRDGIAAGGLSVPRQRYLVRELREAPRIVSELRGALEAYRAALALRGAGVIGPSAVSVLPLADDARPLHVSDEEVR